MRAIGMSIAADVRASASVCVAEVARMVAQVAIGVQTVAQLVMRVVEVRIEGRQHACIVVLEDVVVFEELVRVYFGGILYMGEKCGKKCQCHDATSDEDSQHYLPE